VSARRRALEQPWAIPAALTLAAAAAIVLLTVPLVDGQPLLSYTADDAQITFRYSDNIATGHGPVWNHVGPRADGYTSAAWTFLLALPAALGIGLPAAAKALGLLCAAAIVLMLALAGGRKAVLVRIVAIAALALSPAFLALTVQGMETIFAAMLATAVALLLAAAMRRPGHRELAALSVVCLLAVLARPDLLVFVGLCLTGLGVCLIRAHRFADLRRAGLWVTGAFAAPGLVWAAWRWSYYGYPLPNTAYVKGSGGFTNWLSRHYVGTFITEFAPPYLVGLGVLSARAFLRRRSDPDPSGLWAIGTALVAALAYITATLFVVPIQGNFWRFQMPVFPVLLLGGVLLAARDPVASRLGLGGGRWARMGACAAAVALVAFPLTSLGETQLNVRGRWTYDREQVGKALARFEHDGLSMLVTESGALPLYSGWRSSDLLGLNDHEIARNGATPAYLDSLHPDLIQFVVDLPHGGFTEINRLLATGDFTLARAVLKTNRDLRPGVPPQAHFYFVRTASRHAGEVVATLRSLRLRDLGPATTRRVLGELRYRRGPAPAP
jgi:hypothetical protein